MNPETGRFGRCAKHQSQNFTGFCPICLVERLSNVDCVESAKNPSCGVRNEIFEISESFPVSQRKNDGFRVRKTLLYLFELDDLNELEKIGRASTSHKVCACSLGIDQLGLNFELEGKGLDDRAGASGCSCASGSTSFDGEKSDPLGGESLKDRRIAFWLHSKLSIKRWKWRSRSTSNKGTGIESTYLDDKPKLWEKPRHSWDGSMMSKALSCSFSCLEEQQDGSGKIKTTFPDGSNDHNSFPTDASFGHLHKGFHGRKKSNGWIRVWDWSITSPFRDFAKRNGQVLERSLSESWRDNHRDNDAKYFHPGIEVHRNGTPSSNGRVNRSLSGDIVAANDNRKGQKPDLQKMREFKLSRSHSVRYSSPGNHDNGLLRFYLTPLRTSRRNTAKCRRRTSHSLARGFLGP